MWKEFIGKNCDLSYSLAVCLAVLELWEHGVQNTEEAHEVLGRLSVVDGFSGAQADMCISYALNGEPDGWLDKTMQEVSTKTSD